jgi:hypothetical protein
MELRNTLHFSVKDTAVVSPCSRVGVFSHLLGLEYFKAVNASFPFAFSRKFVHDSAFACRMLLK